MAEGVDFAWGRPGGLAIKNAGKTFVARYVPYNNVSKGLSRTELTDYLFHGLSVVMVMEVYAGDALLGYAKGREHGLVALQGMRSVGLPDSVPIYFAVDVDAQGAQLYQVDSYLRGAASAVGSSRVGVYGGVKVIDHCAATGTAKWFWQTYAWSYGAISPHTHFLQYDNYGNYISGVPVDLNRSFRTDFGQYPRPFSPPVIPDTSTPPKPKETLPVRYQAVRKKGTVTDNSNLYTAPSLKAPVRRSIAKGAQRFFDGLVPGTQSSDPNFLTYWVERLGDADTWDGEWLYIRRDRVWL